MNGKQLKELIATIDDNEIIDFNAQITIEHKDNSDKRIKISLSNNCSEGAFITLVKESNKTYIRTVYQRLYESEV